MNTFTYLIYLSLTYFITVHVGLRFNRNGRIYILRLTGGDERLTDSINRLLLTGYYLLNLGYAALMIRNWRTVDTITQSLLSIATMTGTIMLTLAVIHFLNMLAIYLLSRKNHHFFEP